MANELIETQKEILKLKKLKLEVIGRLDKVREGDLAVLKIGAFRAAISELDIQIVKLELPAEIAAMEKLISIHEEHANR